MNERIHRFEEVASTNIEARRLIESGAESGTVVVARGQNAGRGRRGRTWFSPPTGNLYLSYIHRTGLAPKACASLTLDVGLVIGRLLSRRGLDASLKWPNDVLLGGRKVAGILCELVTDREAPVVIIGIGVNVNGSEFPEELTQLATSVLLQSNEPMDLAQLEADLLRDLQRQLMEFEHRGGPDIAGYRRLCDMTHRHVSLGDGSQGEVLGVADDGGLRVRTELGERVVRSGEVTFLHGESHA